jgi:peroxiredoxin Q/BCP
MIHMKVQLGQQAPLFSLPDQTGKKQTLKDYRGKWVVLYFYPADDTPGCTKQACDIRDSWATFKAKNIVVFGISPDTVESHQTFSEKYTLPFPLLADPEKKVLEDYGAWEQKISFSRILFGIQRSTVIIDPKGKIAKIYKRVQYQTHAEKILQDLETLQKTA